MPDQILCKVPIGIAYQRPLRTEQTYEEQFWQSKLLQPPDHTDWRDILQAISLWALLFTVVGGILVCFR